MSEQPTLNEKDLKRLEGIVANAVTIQRDFLNRLMDPRRNVEHECGYPVSVSVGDYQNMYDRFPVPARVVEALPVVTWQVDPLVYETEDPDVTTPFEQGVLDLGEKLKGDFNHLQGEEYNPVNGYLFHADVQSGIGHYGVVLLGLDDVTSVEALAGPARLYPEGLPKSTRSLTHLRVFPESQAQVTRWEVNPASPRFNQPTEYMLTLNEMKDRPDGWGPPYRTLRVHWTRVLHVADGDTYHMPRMQQVWNNLLDLKKLYGGSAEMYWQGAFPGIAFETNPNLTKDELGITTAQIRDIVENYRNSLQRFMAIFGMTVKTLAPTVVDPTPQIMAQLRAITIRMDIPLSVFVGVEKGETEVAGESSKRWNRLVRARRNRYATHRVVATFYNRLIALGVLPKPDKGYTVTWPDAADNTEQERVNLIKIMTDALVKYVVGKGQLLMSPIDFLTSVWGLKREEAEQVVGNAKKYLKDNPELFAQLTQPAGGGFTRRSGAGGAGDRGQDGGNGRVSKDGGGADPNDPTNRSGLNRTGQAARTLGPT